MIYIGLGANLPGKYGDAGQTLEKAIEVISQSDFHVSRRSQIWHSAPVPFDPLQPWYKNAVIAVSTDRSAKNILNTLLDIERQFGRSRTVKNAPRVLDLDLLAYDNLSVTTPDLTIPHPRMHERAFVLNPLKEIAPDWLHPGTGETIDALIARIPNEQQAFLPHQLHEQHESRPLLAHALAE